MRKRLGSESGFGSRCVRRHIMGGCDVDRDRIPPPLAPPFVVEGDDTGEELASQHAHRPAVDLRGRRGRGG